MFNNPFSSFNMQMFSVTFTIICLSCRSSWRRRRRCSSRESSRERKISSSWERLWSLIRWVWRRREVCFSLSSDSLKPESLCPNSALHRQQWRTVRGSILSSSAPLREAALSWYGWSEIRKSKKWVELKDDWSDWSRRSMIWGGETLSWSSFHTHRITSSSCR